MSILVVQVILMVIYNKLNNVTNEFQKGLLAVGDVSTAGINKNDFASKLLFGDAGSVTAVEFDK